ncbi:MAG TPA: hypothetical protein PLS53_00630 [Thermoanaerobaculaceae bacterium]|nr:hypothetical protein [Thermoanaerobaculaceae bacterium]HPS76640.1 hypothetical protein [Thermoanaerobaculaceae bacterium]
MAEKKPFLLRISPELWEELQRWAADELRSVNGQIEFVLRQAVAERRRGRPAPPPAPPERTKDP